MHSPDGPTAGMQPLAVWPTGAVHRNEMFYKCIDFPIWPLSLAHCLIFLETSTHSMHNLCVYSCGRRWPWKKLKSDSVLKMILHQFCWLSLCTVQVMMGAVLQRRLAGKGVVVSALHPGMVSAYIHVDIQPITAKTMCGIEKWTLYTFSNSSCTSTVLNMNGCMVYELHSQQ